MPTGCLNTELAIKDSSAYPSSALSEEEDLQGEPLPMLFLPVMTTGRTLIYVSRSFRKVPPVLKCPLPS